MFSEYEKKVNDFLTETNTKFEVVDAYGIVNVKSWGCDAYGYKIKFTRNGKQYSTKFYMGLGNGADKIPTAYDVLSALTKYEVGSFYDFCDEFGYDEYDEANKAIYNAVINEYKNVVRMWGDVMDELEEIN